MSNFLQRRCPVCGRQAVKIARDKLSTRTCLLGHSWFPVKNPDPVPDEPIDPKKKEPTDGAV